MKVEVHALTCSDEKILPYLVRHYRTFSDKIVIHDLGSKDNTVFLAHEFGCEVKEWDSNGEFDDILNQNIKNICWHGTDADWVICCDCDEFLYLPMGAEGTFMSYNDQKIAAVKPYGFEMVSESFPTTPHQIYDEVKDGASEDEWYSKTICFSPKLVKNTAFSVGAHALELNLKDGTREIFTNDTPKSWPPAYLLHFRHIYPVEEIARQYDERRRKLSKSNVDNKWGNFEPGIKHATDKRNFILKNIQRVI